MSPVNRLALLGLTLGSIVLACGAETPGSPALEARDAEAAPDAVASADSGDPLLDAAVDASVEPAPDCEPLDLAGVLPVAAEHVQAAAPAPAGGTPPADGEYRLVRFAEYDPPAFDAGPLPAPLVSRSRISGSGRYFKTTQAFPMGPYTTVSSVRYEGTRVFVRSLCPTPSSTETAGGYTASAERIEFFTGLLGSRVVVSTYERSGP